MAVTPSRTFNSPVDDVTPSRMLSSAAEAVIAVVPILSPAEPVGAGIVTNPVKEGLAVPILLSS